MKGRAVSFPSLLHNPLGASGSAAARRAARALPSILGIGDSDLEDRPSLGPWYHTTPASSMAASTSISASVASYSLAPKRGTSHSGSLGVMTCWQGKLGAGGTALAPFPA